MSRTIDFGIAAVHPLIHHPLIQCLYARAREPEFRLVATTNPSIDDDHDRVGVADLR